MPSCVIDHAWCLLVPCFFRHAGSEELLAILHGTYQVPSSQHLVPICLTIILFCHYGRETEKPSVVSFCIVHFFSIRVLRLSQASPEPDKKTATLRDPGPKPSPDRVK